MAALKYAITNTPVTKPDTAKKATQLYRLTVNGKVCTYSQKQLEQILSDVETCTLAVVHDYAEQLRGR